MLRPPKYPPVQAAETIVRAAVFLRKARKQVVPFTRRALAHVHNHRVEKFQLPLNVAPSFSFGTTVRSF